MCGREVWLFYTENVVPVPVETKDGVVQELYYKGAIHSYFVPQHVTGRRAAQATYRVHRTILLHSPGRDSFITELFSVLLSSDGCALRTVGLYVTGLRTEENAAVARGFAMALGVLPRRLAGGW